MAYDHDRKLTSGKWLVLTTSLLMLIGFVSWTLHSEIGLSEVGTLGLLALLGGIIYAFTNANDQRVLRRRCFQANDNDESLIFERKGASGFLSPDRFIVWAGLIGAILTWATFPIIYNVFSAPIGRSLTQMPVDLSWAANLTVLGAPAFVLLGLLTFLNTLSYLHTVRNSILNLVFPTIATTAITIMIGIVYFDDPIVGPEFGIPLLITSMVAFTFSNKVAMERNAFLRGKLRLQESFRREDSRRSRSCLAAMVFVSTDVARSFLLRNVLTVVQGTSKFFVAVSLRALYFSLFMGVALFWYIAMQYAKVGRINLEFERVSFMLRQNAQKVKIVMITSLTFVAAFSISTPTFAYNLTSAPLIFSASQILAYPVLSAWYYTGGSKKHFTERLVEVFGKISSKKTPDLVLVVFYSLSAILCIAWIFFQAVAA